MKKLSDGKSVRIAVMVPQTLNDQIIRRAAKETLDRKRRITTSQIIRRAVKDYLGT